MQFRSWRKRSWRRNLTLNWYSCLTASDVSMMKRHFWWSGLQSLAYGKTAIWMVLFEKERNKKVIWIIDIDNSACSKASIWITSLKRLKPSVQAEKTIILTEATGQLEGCRYFLMVKAIIPLYFELLIKIYHNIWLYFAKYHPFVSTPQLEDTFDNQLILHYN